MKYRPMAWLLTLSSLSLLAHAQGIPLDTRSGSELGIALSDYSFESDRDGVFAMSVQGKKLGITGSFVQALNNGWYWGGDGRIATSTTSMTSATLGRRSGDPETLGEARLTLGRDLDSDSQVLSPYTGIGYRSIYSYLKGYTDTGNMSTTRSHTMSYILFGATHRLRLGSDARLATTLEYDYMLEGTQRTNYTDIAGYTQDLHNSQRLGHGARFQFAYETQDWSAGVFYHYWNIQESDVGTYAAGPTVYVATEPHNITRELGVLLKYRFH